MTNRHACNFLIGLMLSALALSTEAIAADADYGFSVGVEQTNNIERAEKAAGNDETITRVGFSLAASEQTKRFSYNLDAQGDFLNYLNSTFKDEFLAAIGFQAKAELLPGRISWIVDDRFGQLVRNTLNPDNPANRDDTNVFSTGPDFTLKLGATTSMILSGRYVNNYYDKQTIDNDRMSATLALLRQFSPSRSGSLVLNTERVEYDNVGAGSNYDRQEAFFRFQSAVSNGTVGVDIGTTSLHDRGTSETGLLARVNLARQLPNQINIAMSAATQFSDAGQIFLAGELGDDDFRRSEDVLASGDPLRRDSFYLSVSRPIGRGQLAARLNWSQDGFENQTAFDRDSLGIYLNYDRQFRRGLQGRVFGSLVRQDFNNIGRDDDVTGLGAEMTLSLSKKWWLTGGAYRYERNSSLAGADFEDLRALVSLNYQHQGR